MEKLEGASTALITPMRNGGSIDYETLKRLAEFQLANRTHNLVPCGTTAQSPTLTWEEHCAINNNVIEFARNAGRSVPVIVGCGSNSTAEAVRATIIASDHGASATLHVTGYYNWPSQYGILQYFDAISHASGLPVIMYDVCGRGHPKILAPTRVAAAYYNDSVIGVKDATGDKKLWKETRRVATRHDMDIHRFKIISGDDPNTFEMVTDNDIQAVGVISVGSNIFPHAYAEEMELLAAGDRKKAKELDAWLEPLNTAIGMKLHSDITIDGELYDLGDDSYKNPQPIHAAMWILGMIPYPHLRSPLGELPVEGLISMQGRLLKMHETRPDLFELIQQYFRPKPSIADRLRSSLF